MNAPFARPVVAPERHRFSQTEVQAMAAAGLLDQMGAFEVLDGDIVHMPSEGGPHLDLKAALNLWLARTLPASFSLVCDGTLFLDETNLPEPDFYLFDAALRPSQVRGPDVKLLIELSDTSLRHDLHRKADLYRAFGVQEYWVADLNAYVVHRHGAAGWPAPAVSFATPLMPAALPGLSIRLADFL